MGSFYGSVQIRSDDRESVRSVLEQLARKKHRFLLGPPLDGWIGVYPDGHGQDMAVARALAQRLPGEILAMLVHDDDVFAYEFYRDGQLIDQYDSAPDYFEEVSEEQKGKLRGRPETLAHLAADPAKFAAMRDRLAAQAHDPVVFASELLEAFADALGIRNALTSYEYLQENEETDDVESWDEFIHVPDLSREKTQRREADAALAAEKQRLIHEGRLLAERGGLVGWAIPCLCPSPDGRGFLVAWGCHVGANKQPRPLERHAPPWSAGPSAMPWTAGAHVFGLELSPSGRYIAAAPSPGDWQSSVWDLRENRPVAGVPPVREGNVGFLPDESAIFSVIIRADERRFVIAPIGGGDERVISVPYAKFGAFHPSGSSLVVYDDFSRLLVVDVASGRVTRTRLVGGRYSPSAMQSVAGMMEAARAHIDLDAIAQQMRQQQAAVLKAFDERAMPPGFDSVERFKEALERQLEEQIRTMRERSAQSAFLPPQFQQDRSSEDVCRFRFDPSGDRLALATVNGVRVYSWPEVADFDGVLPRPALAVDVPGTTIDTGRGAPHPVGGIVYDLEYDPDRDRLLFAGIDGRVRFLDLASGHSGILLEPPTRPPILQLTLSRDRSTLALIATTDIYKRSANGREPILQFWDYREISRN